MGKLFGTDGIRGVANRHPITSDMGLKLGKAIARFIGNKRPYVVVGRDTRLSGQMLEYALGAGLMAEGSNVWAAGIIPTPGLAYLTRELGADAGVVLSASHNPFQHNGFKVFSSQGTKLTEEEELELERLISEANDRDTSARDVGTLTEVPDATDRYVRFLSGCFEGYNNLNNLKVVLDCANGASYLAGPMLFQQLGAKVIPIAVKPNGSNINEDCGSQHPERLTQKVVETGAHVGFAFDGDGDRVVAVDEKGHVLTGDQLIAILAKMLKEQGKLDNNTVVSTVMSNMGLKVALENMGIEHVTTQVGDRNVYQEMITRGSVLGGEDSGHIILLRHHSTGDGMLSALQVLVAMEYFGKPLSELGRFMEVYPQVLLNVDVSSKPPLSEIPDVEQRIRKIKDELGRSGRVLVRYSGTENVCRIMVEGENETKIRKFAEEIAEALRRAIDQ